MSKAAQQVITNISKYVRAYEYAKGRKPESVTLYQKDFDALERLVHKDFKNQHGKEIPPPPLKKWNGIQLKVIKD